VIRCRNETPGQGAAPLHTRFGALRENVPTLFGKTESGRFLKVIYVPDDAGEGLFVITAYDLGPKALRALRRRLGRRQ
jgi:hypothetical protein